MVFKRILSFILATLCCFLTIAQQTSSYDKTWNRIDSLILEKALTATALTEVNKLYARAKAEKNNAQIIKALLYRIGLEGLKEEDSEIKSIKSIEKEITTAAEPAKSILSSLAAELYQQYLNNNRWRLYNRTSTINFKKDDIATWGFEDLHKKITQHYLASIRNEKILQQAKLEPLSPIIIKGNVRHLRPTLYDLLVHRAIEYFRNDESDITKPAYAFEIDRSDAFAPAAEFVRMNFASLDSGSNQHKALQLYQKLIGFHLGDTKPDALIDVDIHRLQFVYQNSTINEKDSFYIEALNVINTKFPNFPAASMALYLLAEYHADKATEYEQFKNDSLRYEYVKAKEIVDRILAQKDSSEGKTNAAVLLNSILEKKLNIETERVNVTGLPFRSLVRYRNFSQLHFRIIRVDKRTRDQLNDKYWEENYWKQFVDMSPVKSFTQTLPETNDYQPHKVEIKIDPLPFGEYIMLASVNGDYSLKENLLAVQFFHVSNIAFFNYKNDYFVVERNSGKPIPRANIQVWYNQYDYNRSRNVKTRGENILTDANGFFRITPFKGNRNPGLLLEITSKEDYLFLNETVGGYVYEGAPPPNRDSRFAFLFTDRSIYRPGQTIHFKGIMVTKNPATRKSSIIADLSSMVYLYDVNGQKADSITVRTNEFGSYSGKFRLPENVLNGRFWIQDKVTHNSQDFNVEEYKRPKFFVQLEKPGGTYKLNDSVSVKGQAQAYAGNNIDGALVKYRVVRRTRIPLYERYGFGRRIWPPSRGEEMEIAHGTTVTDANGIFLVPFKAVPDNSVTKSSQPIFYYEISADITDINGETRSGNTSINVSYQAIQLSLDIPEKMPADSLKSIRVRSTNMNDVFEKTNVTVSIYKLKSPNRVFRNRYWEEPDQFIFTKEEYYRLFPYDIYGDEDIVSKWEKERKETEFSDTTYANTSGYTKGSLRLGPGWYFIEAITKDKYGEDVKALKFVELTGAEITNHYASGEIISNKNLLEPGETLNYQLRSNLDSVWTIHQVNRVVKDSSRTFVTLNRNSKSFNIPTTEDDRGGIKIEMVFVKYNRFFTESQMIQVPYTNKDLTISYASYRDKTLPGSEERWKLKISGNKTDKTVAELLTGMYDASLDQFNPHNWTKPRLWEGLYVYGGGWTANFSFGEVQSQEQSFYTYERTELVKSYDKLLIDDNLNAIGSIGYFNLIGDRSRHMKLAKPMMNEAMAAPAIDDSRKMLDSTSVGARTNYQKGNVSDDLDGDGVAGQLDKQTDASVIQVRKNFNETAFFFPDLKTDSTGAIEFSFTIPEALTEWKWMSLAHTKDLAFGYSEAKIVTQKELMVQPNAPRFLREGDRIDFSGKIVNMSDKELTGQVELQLIDPTNNQPVDGWFRNFFPNQYFTVAAGQSSPISFTIEIPFQYNKPVTYRVIANTGKVSDGEEASLPVLTNRMLVTESLPLNVRGNGSKQFRFEKLIKSGSSESLNHHALTVEYTSNPAWYAVQALPYLMEYPYDCAEQVFNRYYANALASMIANSSPRIAAIFEKWKTLDTAALMSNLQKNQELKAVLLQETPWVMQAKSEEQQKKNIALLFDMVKMNRELESSLRKLQDMQSPNGGFVWFKGMPEDRYITQYILTGIGHLKKLNALPKNNTSLTIMIQRAVVYLDKKLKEDYDKFLKQKKATPTTSGLSDIHIQFLYMRSFFTEQGIPGEILPAYNYYRKQSQQNWVKQTKYMQGMIALSLFRTGDVKTSNDIIASLKQNALHSEEMGMYWKEFNSGGYYWYQAPIESHSLLIEVFAEAAKDGKSVDDLKTWLLKQKQTQHWKTTKATADACYALLVQGSSWLTVEPEVNIQLGSTAKFSSKDGAEAGTGYFKKVVDSKLINPEMGNITVSVSSSQNQPTTSWGSVYWQYFEDLDKITPSSTPLKLTKKLFVEKQSDRGLVIQPLNEGDALKVGDKVKVRIELRVDRSMEYVHMKDMRAASLEPVNVISSYKYQGGLGYYESTKDASTNFFFGYLPRGTWVFEYPLFVTHTGTFNNGVTSIQCMYAPEFTSHSEGIKIRVE